jgi:hypothetical protein
MRARAALVVLIWCAVEPVKVKPPAAPVRLSASGEEYEEVKRLSSVKSLPVKVVLPALPMVPVVRMLSAPVSMAPKLRVIEPESNAPTVVREEVRTPVPNVVAERTEVPLIRYTPWVLVSPITSKV